MMINAEKLQSIIDQSWTKSEFAMASGMSRGTLDVILKTGEIKRTKHWSGILKTLGIESSALLVEGSPSIQGNNNASNIGTVASRSNVGISASSQQLQQENQQLRMTLDVKDELIQSLREQIALLRDRLERAKPQP